MRALAGIFVGGASSRMNGIPKGLLPVPPSGETIVTRLHRVAARCGVPSVLVGIRAEYTHLSYDAIEDVPSAEGPLGGLLALLQHAEARGDSHVVTLGCDMPYVSSTLLSRLLSEDSEAPVLAPRRASTSHGPWEPFFARLDVGAVLPFARALFDARAWGLQRLFRDAGARMLPLRPEEEPLLDDWDLPSDRARSATEAR